MPAVAEEKMRDLVFPVTGGRSVVVRTAGVFTPADYKLLKTFIEHAGEDAFVVNPAEPEHDENDDEPGQ